MTAPAHARPAVGRLQKYHGHGTTDERLAWLRRRGLTTRHDDAGVWIANGLFCQWFPSAAAAVQAVEAGWPKLPAWGPPKP